jgi:hypothetical protein
MISIPTFNCALCGRPFRPGRSCGKCDDCVERLLWKSTIALRKLARKEARMHFIFGGGDER